MRFKTLGLESTTSIDLVTVATRNMSIEDRNAALAKTKLNEESIKQVLINQKVAESELKSTTNDILKIRTTQQLSNSMSEGTDKAKMFGLSLKGLISSPAGMLTIGMAVISIITGIVRAYKQHKEEMRQAAQEAAQSYQDTANSINEYKVKIQELRSELDIGNLSEQEATNKRKELIEIQKELIENFGAEAEGLNLVTGSIESQISAINNLSKTEWQNFKSENTEGITSALDTFVNFDAHKLDSWGWLTENADGTFSIDLPILRMVNAGLENIDSKKTSTDFYNALEDKLKEILDTDAIALIGEDELINPSVNWNADGKSIYEMLDTYKEVYKAMESVGVAYFGDGNYLTYMEDSLEQVSGVVSKLTTKIDENKDAFNTYVEGLLLYEQQYSSTWGKVLAAQSKYDDALASNDTEDMEKSYQEMEKAKRLIYDSALGNEAVTMYLDEFFGEFEKRTATVKIKFDLDESGGFDTAVQNAINTFSKDGKFDINLANSFSTYETKATMYAGDELDEHLTKGEKAYGVLAEKAKEYNLEVKDLIDILTQLGYVQSLVNDGATEGSSNKSFSGIISGVNNLSTGLDMLDKIYADVLDGGDFDWSSIFGNEDFKEVFSGLDSYEAFMQTIANSPKDISACQSAFNSLVTEYINGSNVMSKLTDETRDTTIAILEQMGVANAAEVIDRALAVQKQKLAYETQLGTEATYDGIIALYNEQEAGSVAQQALGELLLEKLNLNNLTINCSADIDQVISLANAARATAEELVRLQQIKSLMSRIEAGYGDVAYLPDYAPAKAEYNKLKTQAQSYLDGTYEKFTSSLNPNDFKYTGGSNTQSARNKGSSGSSSGSGSSASEPNPTIFDWIEVAVDRIERSIDNLDKKVNNVYKLWSERNGSLKNEMGEITREISLQQQAYNRYMQQANSVGLSADWVEKIKNGRIDISSIADENLSDKISDFQKWYEKALECSDAIDDLNESLSKLYQQSFDNVSTRFDGILSGIEHQASMLDEYINQSEQKGYIVSTKYYEALMKNEQSNISQLESERNEFLSALQNAVNSGAIKEGSEAWYEMSQQIDEVTLSIEQANTAMIEYSNSIRDIQWEIFDLLQDRISYITKEAEFLISLMENDRLRDDNGQLTDEGMATAGLHGMNYNVYMAQADKYAQEIQRIDKELANDPYNQDIAERRQELLELQQEMILAAQDEKEAIRDMVSEGIEVELEALQDLIDKYNDFLDAQRDLHDYQNKIKDQTKEIADIRKQLSAYQNDTSEETKAKVQQLQVSLSKAQEDLEETQYDKYVTDQKKLLDELYNEYESILNQRLDNIDALIVDMINEINNSSNAISDTIIAKAEAVGYTLSNEMLNIWNSTGGTNQVLSIYGEKLINGITSVNAVLNTINTNIQNMLTQLNKIAGTNVNSKSTTSQTQKTAQPKPTTPTTTTPPKPTSNPTKTDKDYYGVALAIWNGNYGWGTGATRTTRLKAKGFDAAKVQAIVNQLGKDGYVPSGAWAGKYYGIKDLSPYHYNKFKYGAYDISKNQMAWTQENGVSEAIIRPSDGAILTPLKKGDSVLNGEATANLFDMMNDPSQFIRDNLFERNDVGNMHNVNNVSNTTSVNLENINFNLPNVKNYEELFYAMQHDRNFEKLVRAMTIDAAFGGSSLKKYNL